MAVPIGHFWIGRFPTPRPTARSFGARRPREQPGIGAGGIDRATPAVDGGEIVKDSVGELTGGLNEHARWPVMQVMGRHGGAIIDQVLQSSIDICHRYGITSAQEASMTGQSLQALRRFEEDGRLSMNVAGHLVSREV